MPRTLYCEWGPEGVRVAREQCDVLVIIDVLSFSTAVDVAVTAGATVFPYCYRDASAEAFAVSKNAELAVSRGSSEGRWSLSPASMQHVPTGTRVVLPSPNGSTLCVAAGDTPTLVGCLRNAHAVAEAAAAMGDRIGIIPAGERWHHDHTLLRPALEDWLGAGAVASHLAATHEPCPDARAAVASFRAAVNANELADWIASCPSGRELIDVGFDEDVHVAADLDASGTVPRLIAGETVASQAATT